MASTRYQAARRDRVVSQLARLEENRRCIDCDNLGPQYVVCGFGVFVCVACSGAHREFGHRVKGISLCSFSEEELNTLEAWGNKRFFQKYCATLPRSFGKPTDRNPDRLREWIERVYVQKNYYIDDTEGSKSKKHARDVAQDSNLSDGIAVIPLSDIFGHNTPLLKLAPSPVSEKYKKDEEKSVSQEADVEASVLVKSEAICNDGTDAAQDLIGDWDPFGVSQEHSSDVIEHKKGEREGEVGKALPNSTYQDGIEMVIDISTAVVPDQVTSTVEHEEQHWDPFKTSDSDIYVSKRESKLNESENKNAASIEKEYTYQEILESLSGIEEPKSKGLEMPERIISTDERNTSPDAREPPKLKQIQPEIPLEEFYPEFAEIRATGLLPDGRPIPFFAHSQVQRMPDSMNKISQEPLPSMSVPWMTESNSCEPSLAHTPDSSARHVDLDSTPPYVAHIGLQGSGTMHASMPIASPTSSVMQVPSTSRASDTLYGGEKAITGYNLNAPCAPKAKDTGNPFA